MFTLLTFVCLSALCWAENYDSPVSDTEYYWKEYFNDEVPSDALPGGHTKNGSVTYIGMVVHPEGKGLIPATIYPGDYAIAQVSFQGKSNEFYIHRKNMQILCSRHHRCYNWVPISISDFYRVPGKIVRAGSEWDVDTYIGRGNYNGEVSIGRVYRPEKEHRGLWLTGREKGEYYQLQDFEVLVYSESCSMCSLDVDTSGNWLIDIKPA